MRDVNCLLMVGISGSGKSTATECLLKEFDDLKLISLDNIREQFVSEYNIENPNAQIDYGHTFVHDQRANKHADRELFNSECLRRYSEYLGDVIAEKKSFVHDRTNLTPRDRQPIIETASQSGYNISAISIVTSVDTIFRRIDERNQELLRSNLPLKEIPKQVLQRQIETFIQPSMDEGFDNMFTVDGELELSSFQLQLRDIANKLKHHD